MGDLDRKLTEVISPLAAAVNKLGDAFRSLARAAQKATFGDGETKEKDEGCVLEGWGTPVRRL